MPAILCSEGKLVYADPDQGVDFGGVTSCMTITCIMTDGSKVAAHDSAGKRVQPHIFHVLRAKTRFMGKKVARIIAAGAASTWTPDMNTQESVSKSLKKSDEYWDKKSLSDQIDAMGPYLVARNVDKFRDNLASLFVGLSRDDVKFKAWDFGAISVTKDGTLQTAYSM